MSYEDILKKMEEAQADIPNEGPSQNSQADFIEYIEQTLIPDLQKSGQDEMVKDWKEAIYWMRARHKYLAYGPGTDMKVKKYPG